MFSNRPSLSSLLAVCLLFVIGACSAFVATGGLTPAELARLSPQARYFQIESEYAIVVEEAAIYASLPFCSDTVIVRCSDPSVVVSLANAKDVVRAQLNSIRPIVLIIDPAAFITAKEQGDALAATRVVLGTMTAILATLIVTSK